MDCAQQSAAQASREGFKYRSVSGHETTTGIFNLDKILLHVQKFLKNRLCKNRGTLVENPCGKDRIECICLVTFGGKFCEKVVGKQFILYFYFFQLRLKLIL